MARYRPRHARHRQRRRSRNWRSAARAAAVAGAGGILLLAATAPAAAQPVTVQQGDTLWALAGRYCGNTGDWPSLYAANRAVIGADPNVILTGQQLVITPADCTAAASPQATAYGQDSSGGYYSCGGLETLWEQAGGAPGEALMAAQIGMAESGGYAGAADYDKNGTEDRGLMQINSSWGPALSTFSPLGNMEAAVQISNDGQDWWPWVTDQQNLYEGQCQLNAATRAPAGAHVTTAAGTRCTAGSTVTNAIAGASGDPGHVTRCA